MIHKSQITIAMALWSLWAGVVFSSSASPMLGTSSEKRGWSIEATELPQFWDAGARSVALASPNGKLVLRVEGKRSRRPYPADGQVPECFLEKDGRHLHPAIYPFASPHAMWSPNSDLLAITSSDGGAVGNWKVHVYSVEAGAVVKHNVMDKVQADLAHNFPGRMNPKGKVFYSRKQRDQLDRDPNWVNVLALHWIKGQGIQGHWIQGQGSKGRGMKGQRFKNRERLLVLAQVPPSSNYGENLGRFRGYIIHPRTGDILRTYREKEFRQIWGKYLSDGDSI